MPIQMKNCMSGMAASAAGFVQCRSSSR